MGDESLRRGNGGRAALVRPPEAAVPPRERGRTFIHDEVISIIAHKAAEQVEGIHRIGSSAMRGMRSRLGRHPGVDAEVGERQAAIDIEIEVEFGYPIRQVAGDIRQQVIGTVETMTGREVVEVNVFITDVHLEATDRHRRQLE